MTEADNLKREIAARRQAERGHPADHRASLDVDTVLAKVMESARWGAPACVGEAGAPQDFLTSGFAPRGGVGAPRMAAQLRTGEQIRALVVQVCIPDLLQCYDLPPSPVVGEGEQSRLVACH